MANQAPGSTSVHSTLALAGAAAALAVSAFAAGTWYGRRSVLAVMGDPSTPKTSAMQQNGAAAGATPYSPSGSVALSLPVTPHFTPRVTMNDGEAGTATAAVLADGPSTSYPPPLQQSPSRNGHVAALSRSSSMSSVMSFALPPVAGVGSGERPKLVVLVRGDLLKAWGKQRLAAMCIHVALAQFKKQYKRRDAWLTAWEYDKNPKVILRVPDEAELVQVLLAAKAAGLPTHSVFEAAPGPAGRSRVIAAVGPAPADALNSVVSQLALL